MTTNDFDSIFEANVEGVPDALLLEDIKQLIVHAESSRPRSLQKTLGPSSVGHKCRRKLAYGLAASRRDTNTIESKGANKYSDPMPAIFGTALHSWMEDAVRADNQRRGRVRWVPEQKVVILPTITETRQSSDPETGEITDYEAVLKQGLSGTCDLYDYDTSGVYDWKFPGATRYSHYAKHGPSDVYRGQAHLYGRGYVNLGLPVENVGIVFISRTGTLRQIHLWREPYNPDLVDEILTRIDEVEAQMVELDVMNKPTGFLEIPVTSDDDCTFCPWWSPNPQPSNPYQCGGPEEGRIQRLITPTLPLKPVRRSTGTCVDCDASSGFDDVQMPLCDLCKYQRTLGT